MRIIIILFLLTSLNTLSQTLPFELERYEPKHYENLLEKADTVFANSEEAFSYYLLSYKHQRSLNPSDYFPIPEKRRTTAKNYLTKQTNSVNAQAVISFFESSGEISSLKALNKIPINDPILLPYQFIAAYLLNDSLRKKDCLKALESQGMLSQILKAFGANMILSSGNEDVILTNGIQDLIAVEYALMTGEAEKKVRNIFATKCMGYKGKSIEAIMKEESGILLSPAVNPSLIRTFKDHLQLKGIGYYKGYTDPESSLLNKLNATSKHFSGIGLKPMSPADRGILKSYSRFYFAVKAAKKMNFIEGRNELLNYLKEYS